MAQTQIYIHVVWCTKCRENFFTKPILQETCEHIKSNAAEKGIFVDQINGHQNHFHMIVSLAATQNIAEIVKLLKGESAFWINNKMKYFRKKLKWAEGYYAVSVSQSHLEKIRTYIQNQHTHHSSKTFEQELEEFKSAYGFDYILGEEPEYPQSN